MSTPRHESVPSDDRGMGLVLVIGMTFMLAIIVAASMSIAVGSLSSSRLHVDFDTSLDAAETGLDASPRGLSNGPSNSGGAYSTQATDAADLSLDRYTVRSYWASPPTTQYWNAGWETTPPTPAQETAWARAAFAGIPNQCLRNAGQGRCTAFSVPELRGNALSGRLRHRLVAVQSAARGSYPEGGFRFQPVHAVLCDLGRKQRVRLRRHRLHWQ